LPVISDVRERRGRSRVFLDGEYWAELETSVADRLGVATGAVFTDAELDEARLEGERTLAMDRALHFLGYRARSRAEVVRRLRKAGFGERTVEVVMGRLVELGYLDDGEFARAYVEGRAGKYGPKRLMRDLRQGGVDPEISRRAIEERFDVEGEREAAFAAAQRRYNTEEGSDAEARRVYGFLARRGFSAEVCAEVAGEFRGGGEAGRNGP
jgi:regulatory protein